MSNFQFLEGKAKASVVDGMEWNQPLLRGMTRLVDDSGRRANKGNEVKGKLGNVGRWKSTGRRHGGSYSVIVVLIFGRK